MDQVVVGCSEISGEELPDLEDEVMCAVLSLMVHAILIRDSSGIENNKRPSSSDLRSHIPRRNSALWTYEFAHPTPLEECSGRPAPPAESCPGQTQEYKGKARGFRYHSRHSNPPHGIKVARVDRLDSPRSVGVAPLHKVRRAPE